MLKSCFNYCCYLFASPSEEHAYQLTLLTSDDSQTSIEELKTLIMNAIPPDHAQQHRIEINGIVEVSYYTDPINGYSIISQYIGSTTQPVYKGRSPESYEQACAHLFSEGNKHSILQDAPAIITPY